MAPIKTLVWNTSIEKRERSCGISTFYQLHISNLFPILIPKTVRTKDITKT